jgi:hypothetical protein
MDADALASAAGVLADGDVAHVIAFASDGVNSSLAVLTAGDGTYVVKRPPITGAAAAQSRGVARFQRWYEREVKFYQELSPACPLKTPRTHLASWDAESNDFTLVLERLPLDEAAPAADATAVGRVSAALRDLGRMHAHFHGSAQLARAESWLPLTAVHVEHAPMIEQHYAMTWQVVRAAYAAELAGLPGVVEFGDGLCASYGRLTARLAQPPRTLLHGDFRLENLHVRAAAAGGEQPFEVCAYDWQFCCAGRPAYDVAYLMGTALPPDARRAAESELRAAYWQGRRERSAADDGERMGGDDGFEDDLRAAVALAFASFVIGAATNGSEQRATHATALTRLAQTALDWDARRLLCGSTG